MTGLARTVLIMALACLLCLGYCLFNTQHLSRNIGYDEVYYFFWVDNWQKNQVYYPHHILFTPTSVLFQRCFTALTGITNTAFIQRFKSILVTGIGLSAFFVLFRLHSKRILLSLAVAILIGVSASVLNDVRHHETSVIPSVIIALTMFSLVFYRGSRRPALFIAVFSVFNSLAILLHQAFLFSVPFAAIVFMFGAPIKEAAQKTLRRLARTGLYLLLVVAMVGGTYFYIGFVKLGLRLTDNTEGTQTYMAVPIHGNFIRYFYLIKAYGKWGNYQPDMVNQGIRGYLNSFVTAARIDRVDPRAPFSDKSFTSTATVGLIGGFLLLFLLLIVPMCRRYGILYPALLAWMVIGALFIFWWEPWYIEHWIYITILTWVLIFMTISTVLDRIPLSVPRAGVYVTACAALLSFASLAFRENFTRIVLPQEKLSLPASASGSSWRDEYRMDEIYRTP
jgi:hypothetical protein